MAVGLMYFDHDHGVERLLFVTMDRDARTVEFRHETAADPTYDEDADDSDVAIVLATTTCPTTEQFDGFCRAFVIAMRATAFSLQDPAKRPFNRMPHADLVLDGFGPGVAPEQLACRLSTELAHLLGFDVAVADE